MTASLERTNAQMTIRRPWLQGSREASPKKMNAAVAAQVVLAVYLIYLVVTALAERQSGSTFDFWLHLGLAGVLVLVDAVCLSFMFAGTMIDELSPFGIRQRVLVYGVTVPLGRRPWQKITVLELVPGACVRYGLVSSSGWVGAGLGPEDLQSVYDQMVKWREQGSQATA